MEFQLVLVFILGVALLFVSQWSGRPVKLGGPVQAERGPTREQ